MREGGLASAESRRREAQQEGRIVVGRGGWNRGEPSWQGAVCSQAGGRPDRARRLLLRAEEAQHQDGHGRE